MGSGNVSLTSTWFYVRMTQAGLLTHDETAFETTALQAAVGMAEDLMRVTYIARLLVAHGRSVDMTGLDHGVGLFCAKALDLPPPSGRGLRPHAVRLLAEMDRLTEALRSQAEG